MDKADLPTCESLGVATDKQGLSELLIAATRGSRKPFRYMDVVSEGNCSGRIFSQEEFPPATSFVPFNSRAGVDLERVAEISFSEQFLSQVRVLPKPSDRAVKGWEVLRSELDGKPIVVVLATWVL